MSDSMQTILLDDEQVLAVLDRLPVMAEKIPVRNLMKALWFHGPAPGKAELRASILAKSVQDLLEDAIQWASVIRTVRTQAGSTPASSSRSSFSSRASHVVTENASSQNRQQSILHRKVQEREAYICPVTGHVDESLNKLEPERFRALLTEHGVESDRMDAAHIIALALPVGENDTENQVSTKQQVLSALKRFCGNDSALIDLREDANSTAKAILLAHDQHNKFGRFDMGFEQTDIPNQYTIIRFSPIMPVDQRDGTNMFQLRQRTATFASNVVASSDRLLIPPPSPALLALHLAFCKVFHASGMAETEEDIAKDADNFTCCTSTGSSDIDHMVRQRMQKWLCGGTILQHTSMGSYAAVHWRPKGWKAFDIEPAGMLEVLIHPQLATPILTHACHKAQTQEMTSVKPPSRIIAASSDMAVRARMKKCYIRSSTAPCFLFYKRPRGLPTAAWN